MPLGQDGPVAPEQELAVVLSVAALEQAVVLSAPAHASPGQGPVVVERYAA